MSHVACVPLLVSALANAPTPVARAEDAAPKVHAPDLSPASAAVASRPVPEEGKAAAHAPAQPLAADASERSEQDLVEGVPGLVRASRATAGEKAIRVVEETIWRVLRPWQQAQSLRQVRYWYVGRTIDAVIHHDGAVEIRDKAGLVLSSSTYQRVKRHEIGSAGPGPTAFGPSGVGVGIGVSDPGRLFTRMVTGKPQDNAEARRLLNDTLELRDRLMKDAARKEDRRALERLRTELQKVWNLPGPLAAKQEQTFALWDQCAEDETGQEGRRQVESFVHMLQESRGECPYDARQLARLNATRSSKRAFSPCTEASDSGAAH